MKSYSCKICGGRGKVFSGTRKEVRKHIKEYHLTKGGKMKLKNGVVVGRIAFNTISVAI